MFIFRQQDEYGELPSLAPILALLEPSTGYPMDKNSEIPRFDLSAHADYEDLGYYISCPWHCVILCRLVRRRGVIRIKDSNGASASRKIESEPGKASRGIEAD
jgi:hypothetical protein